MYNQEGKLVLLLAPSFDLCWWLLGKEVVVVVPLRTKEMDHAAKAKYATTTGILLDSIQECSCTFLQTQRHQKAISETPPLLLEAPAAYQH